ncbi:hypothetical protein BJ741DRAFT_605863 [Chytriomyces cf. hyalinus JEL632]|nr:hypothetical protein BJ741DRAFT_605863 [Chytriomyces cf. hyalinus JEL632]
MSRSRRIAKRQQFAHESQGCDGVRDGWIACVSSQTFNFCVKERIVPYPPQNCAKGTICCASTRQCDFIYNCALVGLQIPNTTAAVSLPTTTIFTPTTADRIETTSPQITHSFTPSSQLATSTVSVAPTNISEWNTTADSTLYLPDTQNTVEPTPTNTDPESEYSSSNTATTNNTDSVETVPVYSSSGSSSSSGKSKFNIPFTNTFANSESSSGSTATSASQTMYTSTAYLPYTPSSSLSISSKSSEAGGKIATPVVGIATPSYHPGQVYIPTQRGFEISITSAVSSFTSTQPADVFPTSTSSLLFTAVTVGQQQNTSPQQFSDTAVVGVFGANEVDDSVGDGSGTQGQGQDTSLAAAAMAVALGASQSTSHGLKEIDNSAFNTGSVRSRATGISRKSSNFTQLMVNATSNQTTGKGFSSNTGSSGLSRQVSAESADTQEDYNTRHLSEFSVFTRAYGESSGIHTWSDENLAPSDNPPKLSIDTPVSGAASIPFSPVHPSPTLSESLNNASKPASKSAATSTSSISITLGTVPQKPVTYLKSPAPPPPPQYDPNNPSAFNRLTSDETNLDLDSNFLQSRLESTDSNASDTSNVSRGHVIAAATVTSHQLRQSILEEDDDYNAAHVGTDYTDLPPSLLSSQNELSESEIDPRESEKRSLRIMVNTFSVLIMDQNGGRGVSTHSGFDDLYELEDEDPDNESIDETDAALQSYDSHVSDASREGFLSPALSEVLVPALAATEDSGLPPAPPPEPSGDEISPEIKLLTSGPPKLKVTPLTEAQPEPSLKSLPSNPSVPDLKIETVPSKPQPAQQPPKSAKSAKNVQAFTGKTEGMHSSQPTHVATDMFFPLRGDEVGLAVGDLLHVMHVHADGWGRAVNLSQGKKQGFVPMSYLRGVKGRIGASKRIVRVVHEEDGDSESLRKSSAKRDDADEEEDAVKPRPSQTTTNNLVWVGALSPSDKRTSLDSIRSNASGRGRLPTRVESLNNA